MAHPRPRIIRLATNKATDADVIPERDVMANGYVVANVTKPMPERHFHSSQKKN
jgi:hypothetical protein